MVPIIEHDKPGTVVFLGYTNDDGTEVRVVHVFPDADAMDDHLGGADERVAAASAFIQTTGYEIYRSPNAQTLETMRGFASTLGASLNVRPHYLGGYLHLRSA